jgi:hypothetical protein
MKVVAIVLALLWAVAASAGPTLMSSAPSGGTGASESWSRPGELLYEEYCYEYDEVWDPELSQYFYYQELNNWFFQEPDNIYWISIQAVLAYPPQWGWCQTDDLWNDEAVIRSEYFSAPDWTPLSHLVGNHVEMAFTLLDNNIDVKWAQYPLPGSNYFSSQWEPVQPGIDSEIADDFLCSSTDPIAHVEWWGGYWNPGEPPFVDHFIIRFYSDIPVSSVQAAPSEDASWGTIKSMFR